MPIASTCQGTQPAYHVQILARAVREAGQQWASVTDPILTGGEDLLNAYRYTPMIPEQSLACIVCYWQPRVQEPRFRRYYGHLFGLPLAVISFNRWSRFLQAILRRTCIVLLSMYFDDARMQDFASTATSAQACVRSVARSFGSPFSAAKSQVMAATGDFLGLEHDLSRARSADLIKFWIRPRLVDQIRGILASARQANQLSAG